MSKTSLRKELRDLQKAAKEAERDFNRALGEISREQVKAERACNQACKAAKKTLGAITRRLKRDRKIARRAYDSTVLGLARRRATVEGRLA